MAELEAQDLAENAVLIGLISRSQMREAVHEAEDGSVEALTRVLLRKGWITSWHRDKLLKGDVRGFFYGNYKVLFHIAEGTFARVYRAQRMDSGDPVAVKVLRRRFSTDAGAVARFSLEAEAGMRLVHENIVRIYENGESDNGHYMVMEYVEGSNLRDFLKLRHRLDAEEALPIFLDLARGLAYSHNEGVTHRDIKGTNILISTKRRAKLVDFGLATLADDRVSEFAHTRTVDYSALERTCGSPKGDHRSDIYFLGCVFYQILTGVLPMPEVETSDMLAKMLKRSFGAIKPIHEMRYAPPPELCRIIEKMMSIKLDRRYQEMDDLVADLEGYERDSNSGGTGEVSRSGATGPSDEEWLAHAFGHGPVQDTKAKNVLCVEVQETIQQAFKKTLSQMGYRVILVRDAERAAERFREAVPDAVVFDADGLGPQALDAFLSMHEKAHEDGHELSALVLLGPRQGHLAESLPTDDRLVVLTKPLKMKDVQDAVAQLVPLGK
jgi:CheY-like chemotaxis protein